MRSIVTSPILTAISSDDEDTADTAGAAYIQQHHHHDDDDGDESSISSSNISHDESFTCSEMDTKSAINNVLGCGGKSGSPIVGLPLEAQKWDYLLNYGPSFHRLVGVCNDIANLPDANKPKVFIIIFYFYYHLVLFYLKILHILNYN